MYNQGEIEVKTRRKLLGFTAGFVAVIAALIVAIVVVTATKSDRETVGMVGDDSDKSSFSLGESWVEDEATDKAETQETAPESATTEAPSAESTETEDNKPTIGRISTKTAAESAASASKSETESAAAETVASLPSTGPVDLLPMALLLGILTTVGMTAVVRRRA